MKKLLLSIAACALVATTMTSCKKEYTCDCTLTDGGTTLTASYTLKNTKKKAEDACTAYQTTVGTATYKCTLK
jgi:hypothetical protein